MRKPSIVITGKAGFSITIITILLIALSACTGSTSTAEVETASPPTIPSVPTVTETARALESPTPTKTKRPTKTSTPALSFIPTGARARLGNGLIQKIMVSGNGKALLVFGPVGMFLYDAETMQMAWSISTRQRVSGAAISHDGQRIATFSVSGEVELWDGSDGSRLWHKKPSDRTSSGTSYGYDDRAGNLAAFSPDEKILAVSASGGSEVYLLESSNGKVFKQFSSFMDGVDPNKELVNIESLAFSPDGKTLAAADYYGGIRFWDIDTANPLPSPVSKSFYLRSIAYSPDGKTIAYNSGGQVVFLDVQSGTIRPAASEHEHDITDIVFSPDGKYVVSSSKDNTLKVWNSVNGSLTRTLSGHTDTVTGAGFLADGKQIISGSLDGTLGIWDAFSGTRRNSIRDFQDAVESIAFSSDGKMVVAGHPDGTVVSWDIAMAKSLFVFSGHTESVITVAVSPDGTTIVSGSRDNSVILWDAANGRQKFKLKTERGDVLSVAYSPDGSILVSSHFMNSLMVRNGRTGEARKEIRPGGDRTEYPRIRNLAFTSDGKMLMAAMESRSDAWVAALDVLSWEPVKLVVDKSIFGRDIAFNLDGSSFAMSTGDPAALIDFDKGTIVQTYRYGGERGGYCPIAISPDGRVIATQTSSNFAEESSILLWNVHSGVFLGLLTGHDARVDVLAFSPDGKTLASGSIDGTIILWDVP